MDAGSDTDRADDLVGHPDVHDVQAPGVQATRVDDLAERGHVEVQLVVVGRDELDDLGSGADVGRLRQLDLERTVDHGEVVAAGLERGRDAIG